MGPYWKQCMRLGCLLGGGSPAGGWVDSRFLFPPPFLRLALIHQQGKRNRFSRLQFKQMKSLFDALDLH